MEKPILALEASPVTHPDEPPNVSLDAPIKDTSHDTMKDTLAWHELIQAMDPEPTPLTASALSDVNKKLLENPGVRTCFNGSDSTATPPWEMDEQWFLNRSKRMMESSKKSLSRTLEKCEADIAKLLKLSSPRSGENDDERILSHFEEQFHDQVTQTLSDFRATKQWFANDALGDPTAVTLTYTPEEKQKVAKMVEASKADAREAEASGEYYQEMYDIPIEGGEFTMEQKEYWQTRRRSYCTKSTNLYQKKVDLWTLYFKSKDIRRRRAREIEDQADPRSMEPVGETGQIERNSKSQNTPQDDPAAQGSPELQRQRHLIPNSSVDEASTVFRLPQSQMQQSATGYQQPTGMTNADSTKDGETILDSPHPQFSDLEVELSEQPTTITTLPADSIDQVVSQPHLQSRIQQLYAKSQQKKRVGQTKNMATSKPAMDSLPPALQPVTVSKVSKHKKPSKSNQKLFGDVQTSARRLRRAISPPASPQSEAQQGFAEKEQRKGGRRPKNADVSKPSKDGLPLALQPINASKISKPQRPAKRSSISRHNDLPNDKFQLRRSGRTRKPPTRYVPG